MILASIDEVRTAGAALDEACEVIGISARTVQRWQCGEADDGRAGPRTTPQNKLSTSEQKGLLEVANSEEFRNLPPKQIIPRLADQGRYLASESTLYRLLREKGQLAHRGADRPRTKRPKTEHVASGPNQVWSWDITYLRGPTRGSFLYLYLILDVFSRRIMGWDIAEEESMDRAAALIRRTCAVNGVDPKGLVLHSDNGGPMKGSTMLATLQWLGIVPSFSRPRVSDDNAYSESLFRTLKYRPGYPAKAFASAEAAQVWVEAFVAWYNGEHRHSGIKFVTPDQRHFGLEAEILNARHETYRRARTEHPERWTKNTRNWSVAGPVRLNPTTASSIEKEAA